MDGRMDIVIATKNKGKIFEITDFFEEKSFGSPKLKAIRWLTFEDFEDFPDVEEGKDSFLGNAKLKAKSVSGFSNRLALADDSGLEVEFLGGAPGVISSRYAGENANDRENRLKLLKKLESVKDPEKRRARFVCVMVLGNPLKDETGIFTGICSGTIGFEERGTGGFGYDSIFMPEGYDCTMAELDSKVKNRISHRAQALELLSVYLLKIS
jgi:XTP/dITP diphosphohydrolase